MQADVHQRGWIALLPTYPYLSRRGFSHMSVVANNGLLWVGRRAEARVAVGIAVGIPVGVVEDHDARGRVQVEGLFEAGCTRPPINKNQAVRPHPGRVTVSAKSFGESRTIHSIQLRED